MNRKNNQNQKQNQRQKQRQRQTLTSTALLLTALFALSVHAQSVVLLDNFEVNFDGWTNHGEYVYLDATAEAAYNSARGMSVTGRKSAEDGAMANKGFYLDGGLNYNYSVYVKHAGETAETFNLTITWLMPDKSTTGSEVIATATAAPNTWTRITASYMTPEGSFNPTFIITTNSVIDFFFDDFEVRGRSAGLARSAAPLGTSAIPANVGLKDVYARHFRVGNILNGGTVNNVGIQSIIRLDYNSVTAENEHKPYATMTRTGSTNTDIKATLSSSAAINDFLARNGIPMRGHVLTWHGQSPDWFFVENINDERAVNQNASNAYRRIDVNQVPWASVAVMNQRLESYIKNLFAEFERQYPSLHIYAYDVVNEAFDGNGNMRPRGFDHDGAGGGIQNPSGSGSSPWQGVYGNQNTDWMKNAFRYARRYAPAHTKLFYNDFNEWQGGKKEGIRDKILIPMRDEGVLDGMGMQSHVSANRNDGWSGENAHLPAMDFYANLGIEVQLTELDPNTNGGQYANQQPTRYANIFRKALEINRRDVGKVTAICIWTPSDAHTWIGSENTPSLHNAQNQRKPAYDSVAAIIPQAEWGDGNNPTFEFGIGGGTTGPNEFGWWFQDPFESNTGSWSGRGGSSVATSTAQKALGSRSLAVTNRGAAWQGTIKSLNPSAFKAGTAYSFSVCAMYAAGGEAIEEFKLTLEYTDATDTVRWAEIALRTVERGTWVQLHNSNFTIPTGAKNLSLIVESTREGSDFSFFIDEAIGAVGGTGILAPEGVTQGITSAALADNNKSIRPLVSIRGRTLSISSPDNSALTIRMIDLRGRVRTTFNVEGSARISLSRTRVPAGRYFVDVRGAEVRQTLPIVVR